ncbi:hypothetical protein KKB43_05270 [Patescibacteria group bacterium]|nr:hypothetical protein [Patescibacteria group bacterium]MBU4580396.1 hypothetical protein [Patescibacteria group bacterium]
MSKTAKYISIIIVVVIIAGIFLVWQGEKPAPVNIQPTPTPTPSEIVNWINYINKTLGFSISIPEKVLGVNRCAVDKQALVPLKAFEDNANDVVYFVPEYYYDNVDNPKHGESDCVKKVYSLQLIKDELAGKGLEGKYISSPGNPFLGLAIRLKNVKNDIELTKLIKNNYGLGCIAGEKTLWNQQKVVYEVAIAGADPNKGVGVSNPDCPVNYAVKILYASEKGKVMYATLGQDARFYSNTANYYYDEDIINSFRFE